jgi:thiol-disulfide isomerase/thioredoxin
LIRIKNWLSASLILVALAGCQPGEESSAESQNNTPTLPTKSGKAVIMLNDSTELAFTFKVGTADSLGQPFTIFNGDEEVKAKAQFISNDSVKITLPVFANYIKAKWNGTALTGHYFNPDATDYQLPFSASFSDTNRFVVEEKPCCSINKKWRVRLAPGSEDEEPAIAYFEQEDQKVTGTFLTETGDYRFLEGSLSGTKLQLSAFDGAHLFYFSAEVENSQEMKGHFYSGRSYHTSWLAFRDDDFELANPDTLTYLKEGYENLAFTFPTLAGKEVSLSDAAYQGKPVIVQIMGSWCPNCMDETRYLKEVYEEYHPKGLEFIALTFERARDKAYAEKRVEKMVKDLEIPYPVLIAGYTREDKAAELLPMLNHVMSYPTTIYLDANDNVQKIHTGFSGPSTPVYKNFVKENRAFITALIKK